MKIAFVDTETSGLDPARHQVWEFAAIIRDPQAGKILDIQDVFQVQISMDGADVDALAIGRYHERRDPNPVSQAEAAWRIHNLLTDCVIVGANPTFDVAFLTTLLDNHGLALPWHYRPVCVEAVAYGFMQGFANARFGGVITDFPLPWRSSDVCGALVDRDNYPKHTALGDARWVRDVWDAVHTVPEDAGQVAPTSY